MSNLIQTENRSRFLVWGCGAWPERKRIAEEMIELCTEDMPEFDLLPEEFVKDWEACFGGEHWAEIITCDEGDLDAATRFSPNVYGYKNA